MAKSVRTDNLELLPQRHATLYERLLSPSILSKKPSEKGL
jgi:hypothetical protein